MAPEDLHFATAPETTAGRKFKAAVGLVHDGLQGAELEAALKTK